MTATDTDAPDERGILLRAQRELISRRVSPFAIGWLGMTAIWIAVFAAEGALTPPAALVAGAEALVLMGIVWLCRSDPMAPRVLPLVLATCVALGVASTALAATAHSHGEILAFMLLSLYLAAALLFAWGWRAELVLLVTTLAVWGLVLDRFAFVVRPLEVSAAVTIGALLALVIAEGAERSFRYLSFRRWTQARMTHELETSRDAYRDLAEHAPDLIWACDLELRFTYVNEAAIRFLGRPATAILGRPIPEFYTGNAGNPDANGIMARAADGEDLPPFLAEIATPLGPRWIEVVSSLVRDQSGAPSGLRGISRDVSERVAAETALRDSLEDLTRNEEKLRLLAQRQVAVREEERKRVSFDIHDDVCQELVGVGILVASLRRKLAPMPVEHAAEFERVVGYLGEVVEHLRVLARELRPLLLRDLGLGGALRSLADGLSSAATRVVAEFHPTIPRLDEEVEVAVYRIAQEALANAVRHAGARRIIVALTVADGMLHLEVRDDGRGFDPSARPTMALGLASMEERAWALGGRLDIGSRPGQGTTVALVCPLEGARPGQLREPAARSPIRSSSPLSATTTPRAAVRD